MNDVERAVERLTQEHTEHTEAGAVEWPPLLVWLADLVTAVMGRTGGSGGAGIPLNSDALALQAHIKARHKLLMEAASVRPTGNMLGEVQTVWATFKDDHAKGVVDDATFEKVCDEYQDWVVRIVAEDERPRKMELTVPCPRCDTRWVMVEDERKSAVVIEFAEGRAPVAECRADECGAMWAGWVDMAKLGFTVGAESNMEVLKACGIELPTLVQ